MALLLFGAFRFRGTGAWTGTLAASLLDMDFKSSVVAVVRVLWQVLSWGPEVQDFGAAWRND